MPSVSKRQQRFFASEYARKKAGKSTRTDMSLGQMHDFMSLKQGAPECAMPGCGKKHAEHRMPRGRGMHG